MRIGVFGLGYVGTVSAACLAELGHEVIGVDIDPFKVELLNQGHSPVVEELIDELIAKAVSSGRLRAVTDPAACVAASEMSWICVGTPAARGGELDDSYVRRVSAQIGAALRGRTDDHVVVVRSTVLPGTVDAIVAPLLAASSGRTPGVDLGLCFHPEFLREGSSVRDFRDPPKIVIGSSDARAAAQLASIYRGFAAPCFITGVRVAELVKYADNAFHALKVVFANEIGTLCKSQAADSHEVMRIFCADRKLNISPTYLLPGFAYGGSCLPKDLRALLHLARRHDLDLPLLASIERGNSAHLQRAVDAVLATGKRQVGILGLSFKPGTDDLRESPLVELTERLLGKGCRIRIYDENVSLARLRGGNKAYIEQRLPHIAELLCADAAAVVTGAEVVVVGSAAPAFAALLAAHAREKSVVDLVRLFDREHPPFADYHGVCW